MDKTEALKRASQSINDLAATRSEPSTKMAFLRAKFEQLTESMTNDFSIKEIVEKLNESGLEISVGYFKVAMTVIRKEKGLGRPAKNKGSAPVPPPVATPTVAPVVGHAVNQAELDVLNKYGCDTTDVDDVFSSMVNKGK
jgi:hypothetical protein